MSDWVVLDITAFTKTTTTEKVKKILKSVSNTLVYDEDDEDIILYFPSPG